MAKAYSPDSLYPGFSAVKTVPEATVPDPDAQKAMQDDPTAAEVSGVDVGSKRSIFGAILMIVGVAFVMGVIKEV